MPYSAHTTKMTRSQLGRRPPKTATERAWSSPLEGGVALPFAMSETHENGPAVRLALAGELDIASCGQLQARLGRLAQAGVTVRLDLSRLEFTDSSGLHVLIDACHGSRRDGWQLEIEPALREPVRRVVELLGVDELLWPSASGAARLRP